MKCTKIILTNRSEKRQSGKTHQGPSRQDRNNMWCTSGYHGYSYKLSAGTKEHMSYRQPIEPQLTITTIIFPNDISFNTGASMDRWSKKMPRLISARSKNHTPRRNMLDEEYDFSYDSSEIHDDDKFQNDLQVTKVLERENQAFHTESCYASADIEELILKSHRSVGEKDEQIRCRKKEKKKKRDTKDKIDDTAKKKRNKFNKTIRFSFSRPPSPETEQVIRVEVTSNVSLDEMSHLENNIFNNNLKKNDCSRGHGKMINENLKDLSSRKFDNNNNEKDGDLSSEGIEEDFIVKCRQLALTQKKR